MLRQTAVFALCALPVALPAWAEPATPEGARQIVAAFGRYLPQVENVLTVTPQGDSYDAALKLDGYLALMPGPVDVSLSPIDLTLTDLGGGRWQVAYDQPWMMSIDLPGTLTLKATVAGIKGSGVFDTALLAYESHAGEMTGLKVDELVNEPRGGATTRVAYKLDRMTFHSTAKPAAGGSGVDIEAAYNATGLFEDVAIAGPGQPDMAFKLNADTYDFDFTATGMRMTSLAGMIGWLVAHPSEQAIKADEQGLKDALRAMLPIWDNLEGSGAMSGLKLDTAVGTFTAGTARVGLDVNGVVADGKFRESIAVEGLGLPPGLVPDWAEALVPQDAGFDIEVDGFDAAAPATLALDALSFTSRPPPGLEMKLAQAAMPKGKVTVTLHPATVSSGLYKLTIDGAMDVGPMGPPVGSAKIESQGMDAILAQLNKAPDDVKRGAVAAVSMARGLGKLGGTPDTYNWAVEMTADGKLLVNGNDLSPMLGR